MIYPIVGECVSVIGLLLCKYYDRWPMEYAGIIQSFFPAISGILYSEKMYLYCNLPFCRWLAYINYGRIQLHN